MPRSDRGMERFKQAMTEECGMTRLLTDVTLNPSGGKLPGDQVLQQVVDGIGQWALIASLIGLVIGAAAWALGHYSQNYHQAYNGRRGVLVSGAAALLIGGAQGIVNSFAKLGHGIH
jgi:MFS family permease